jgi:hypothetical protein
VLFWHVVGPVVRGLDPDPVHGPAGRVNSRLAWVETIHAPLPSAAAYWLNRALAMTVPLTSKGHEVA